MVVFSVIFISVERYKLLGASVFIILVLVGKRSPLLAILCGVKDEMDDKSKKNHRR